MESTLPDFWNSVKEQYPDAVEATGKCPHSMIASGARVIFSPTIHLSEGSSVELDLLRRAQDGIGWDIIEVERTQGSYEEQIKKLRSAARALDAAGVRIYSFIYLSANPEAETDSSAAKWTYENISREVLSQPAGTSQPGGT